MTRLLWKIVPFIVLLWAYHTCGIEAKKGLNSVDNSLKSIFAAVDIKTIGRAIQADFASSGELPESVDFDAWMQENMDSKLKTRDDIRKDPWGKKYIYANYFDESFRIQSKGPDKKINTHDDISQEFTTNKKSP